MAVELLVFGLWGLWITDIANFNKYKSELQYKDEITTKLSKYNIKMK